MNVPGILQARLFVARNRRIVAAVLVALAVVSTAGAGMVYANPGTTTATEQRHQQTISSETETRAVVSEETPLYDEGQTLVDKRVYPLDASPTLTLDGSVEAPDGTAVQQRLVVRYRATRDGETVWSESRVLAAAEGQVGDGAERVESTVNITRVGARLAAVREEFAGAATVDVQFAHIVTYETTRYEGTLEASVPLGFTRNAYIVDGTLTAEQSHATPVTVTSEQSPDTPLVGGLLLVGLGALAGAVTLVRRPPSPEGTTEELQRQRYGEWISSGRLPVYAADRYVEMSTLADLVNVAVDSNRRVIHDPKLEAYGIIDEDALYWYARSNDGLLELAVPSQSGDAARDAPRMGFGFGVDDEADTPVDANDGDAPPGFEALDSPERDDEQSGAAEETGDLQDLFES